MTDELSGREILALDRKECPDCGAHAFLKGPRGGMSMNVKCGRCGAAFNVIPGLPGEFGKERLDMPTKLIEHTAAT